MGGPQSSACGLRPDRLLHVVGPNTSDESSRSTAGGATDGQKRAGSFRMGNWIYDLGPAVHVLAAGWGWEQGTNI